MLRVWHLGTSATPSSTSAVAPRLEACVSRVCSSPGCGAPVVSEKLRAASQTLGGGGGGRARRVRGVQSPRPRGTGGVAEASRRFSDTGRGDRGGVPGASGRCSPPGCGAAGPGCCGPRPGAAARPGAPRRPAAPPAGCSPRPATYRQGLPRRAQRRSPGSQAPGSQCLIGPLIGARLRVAQRRRSRARSGCGLWGVLGSRLWASSLPLGGAQEPPAGPKPYIPTPHP